jgi:hypothetical protein
MSSAPSRVGNGGASGRTPLTADHSKNQAAGKQAAAFSFGPCAMLVENFDKTARSHKGGLYLQSDEPGLFICNGILAPLDPTGFYPRQSPDVQFFFPMRSELSLELRLRQIIFGEHSFSPRFSRRP